MQTGLIPFSPNGSVALSDSRYVLPGGCNADPDFFATRKVAPDEPVELASAMPRFVDESVAEAAHMPPGSDPRDALIARLRATIERVEDELTQVYAELERAWAALEMVRGVTADTLSAAETSASRTWNTVPSAEHVPLPNASRPSDPAKSSPTQADEAPESDVANAEGTKAKGASAEGTNVDEHRPAEKISEIETLPFAEPRPSSPHENAPAPDADNRPPRDEVDQGSVDDDIDVDGEDVEHEREDTDGTDNSDDPSDEEANRDATIDGVKISARQRRAALLLAGGARNIEVARAVGVTRNTVQTWKREHAGFQAILNSYSNELHESAQARLLATANHAVSALVNQVLAGDTKTSLQLLKGLGLLTGKPRAQSCEHADELRGIER